MDTITIPRTDYVQRHDDEGRDFYAQRTVETAAELWYRQNPEGRQWDWFNEVISFATIDDEGITLSAAGPDEDMEDLYPAGDLPFRIGASPFAPGDVIVHNVTGASHQVTRIDPSGDVLGQRLPGGGDVNIPADYVGEYCLARGAAAPTGTPAAEPRVIVVTVPEDMDGVEARIISELFLNNTRDNRITVREAR